MSYEVIYSPQARQDLRDTYNYIASSLAAQDTAKKFARRIMDEIASLDIFPKRYPVYPQSPWETKQVRYFSVDNFLVFYLPDEDAEEVYIMRIMYGGRDVSEIMNE